MKKAWGCEKKTQLKQPTLIEEENNIRYLYWNCPIKFIPKSISQFMIIYDYYKDFPSAQMPSINDVSYRFLFATKYYDMKYNEYYSETMKHGKF